MNIRVFIGSLSALLITAFAVTAAGSAAPATEEETLRRGAALTRERRYDDAEILLMDALRAAPSSGELKNELAKVWASRAHHNMREGNLYRAVTWAERAVEQFPGEPDFHFLLGVILLKQGDFYYARHTFEKVLDIDPGNVAAREILGDIYYQEGILDEAVGHWERVLESSSDRHDVRRKVAKARREMEVEEGFGREVSRNFTILFDGPVPAAVIRSVLGRLEESYRTLSGKLGAAPSDDIIVILYGKVDFHSLTGRPRWVGGLYDGKIRVPVGGLATEEDAAGLEPILRHELTHAFLRSIVRGGLPLWFEEGLAEHFEGEDWERSGLPRENHHGWEFESFDEVNRALRGRNGSVELAYLAARRAMETLLSEKGFNAVVDTIDEVAAGTAFPKALEEEAGLTVDDLFEVLSAGKSAGEGD